MVAGSSLGLELIAMHKEKIFFDCYQFMMSSRIRNVGLCTEFFELLTFSYCLLLR